MRKYYGIYYADKRKKSQKKVVIEAQNHAAAKEEMNERYGRNWHCILSAKDMEKRKVFENNLRKRGYRF